VPQIKTKEISKWFPSQLKADSQFIAFDVQFLSNKIDYENRVDIADVLSIPVFRMSRVYFDCRVVSQLNELTQVLLLVTVYFATLYFAFKFLSTKKVDFLKSVSYSHH
jgi:hypothetical protein